MSLRGDCLGLGVSVRLGPALVAGAVAVIVVTVQPTDRTSVCLPTLREARSLLAAVASLPALLAAGGRRVDLGGGGEVVVVVRGAAVAVLVIPPGLNDINVTNGKSK